MSDLPVYFKPIQVSRLLQVSPSTVKRLMLDGTIPSIKVRKCRRVPAREFIEALDRGLIPVD